MTLKNLYFNGILSKYSWKVTFRVKESGGCEHASL